jgi:hypothetical protein
MPRKLSVKQPFCNYFSFVQFTKVDFFFTDLADTNEVLRNSVITV